MLNQLEFPFVELELKKPAYLDNLCSNPTLTSAEAAIDYARFHSPDRLFRLRSDHYIPVGTLLGLNTEGKLIELGTSNTETPPVGAVISSHGYFSGGYQIVVMVR